MDAHELTWALRAVGRSSALLERSLADRLSLRPVELSAIVHLMSAEADPIGPNELGSRLGISTGSAAELAERLLQAGHLERERSHRDRRRVLLRPTESTVRRLLDALSPMFADIDALASEFTSEEQRTIVRFLHEASARIAAHAES